MVEQDLSYIIKFDIPKDKAIKTSDFVEGMKEVLSSLEEFNSAIVKSVDKEIELVSYIEELSAGSIKYKLRDVIKNISEEDVDKFVDKPIKTTIAAVVKKCRKIALEKLDETKDLALEERKMKIVNPIRAEIEASDNQNLIKGMAIDEEKLLFSLSKMSAASHKLQGNCSFIPSESEKEIKIDDSFDIRFIPTLAKEDEEIEEPPQYINGHITIYSPVFDATKTKWKFEYNKSIETIDISKVDIANFILKRGKVVVGDCFKVKLEVVEKKIKNGYKNDYSVVEVLGFIEGNEQKEFQYSFKKEEDEKNY